MPEKEFSNNACVKESPKWDQAVCRKKGISKKSEDVRSEFTRDYHRILHNNAYGRLKHKTQVFFATQHDHICTRIEHVNHVASVSTTISTYLGLNTELTRAIAIGHDLGHAAFGHIGEKILAKIAREELGEAFWHERNSLRFVDSVITLEDQNGRDQNLNLTYGVRDGIVSHCGEVDENALYPRDEAIDLYDIKSPSMVEPYTWEGCVVKVSDKISYLGRDIEDGVSLGFLTAEQEAEFKEMILRDIGISIKKINNTSLIHHFVVDLCKHSSPARGVRFSPPYLELINSVKEFNYRHIYNHDRLKVYHDYAELIIGSLYKILRERFRATDTLSSLEAIRPFYPQIWSNFHKWLIKYSNLNQRNTADNPYYNDVIYDMAKERDYAQAIIDFISGMTDHFAIKLFQELTTF